MTTKRKRVRKGLGWRPDVPDHRDYAFSLTAPVALPDRIDLRANLPIYDQGQLGSCTANAICSAYQYELVKQHAAALNFSRLFLYFNERQIEGTTKWDAGAYIRDGFKALNALGVCLEQDWPYLISKFSAKPPTKAYKSAQAHQALQYLRVAQTVDQMRQCLAAGYPFVFGFSVYESFESLEVERTGVVSMPGQSEEQVGGHAVLAVGYDHAARRFLVQNSWGKFWGQDGFFTIPYDYLADNDLADDFWTLRLVE